MPKITYEQVIALIGQKVADKSLGRINKENYELLKKAFWLFIPIQNEK